MLTASCAIVSALCCVLLAAVDAHTMLRRVAGELVTKNTHPCVLEPSSKVSYEDLLTTWVWPLLHLLCSRFTDA